MSATTIKYIALILMLIDHIGMFFFPTIPLLRVIGRLSFPLFAWTIANGAYHTKNIKAYFYRLSLFALIAQFPYVLSIQQLDPHFTGLNIFFTLALGLLAIILVKKTRRKWYRILIVCSIALFAQLIQADYGAYGIFVIMIFYRYFYDWSRMFAWQAFFMSILSLVSIYMLNFLGSIRFVGILSVFLLRFYSKKKGGGSKYVFYILYPLQFVIFFLIYLLWY